MVIGVSASNGKAPASALGVMPGRNGNGTQHSAPHSTVAGYGRIRSAMKAAGLGDLVPSNGWSCYRDRAAQQHMRDIGLTTVAVGRSIHGEWKHGSAVDFSNLGGFGAARHNWLKNNGGAFGWYQPRWAQASGSIPEPWHWEYDQHGDSHINDSAITEDDDMTPEQARSLAEIQRMLTLQVLTPSGRATPGTEDEAIYVQTQRAAAENAGEGRRILTFMVTGVGAATEDEVDYVLTEQRQVENGDESRRMLGVQLGWQAPAPDSPEPEALAKLWNEAAVDPRTPPSSGWSPQWVVGLILALLLGIAFAVSLNSGVRHQALEAPDALLYVLGGGLLAWLSGLGLGRYNERNDAKRQQSGQS